MKYDDKRGKDKEITANWYCTSTNGKLMNITDLSSFSSENKFYLVFEGKIDIEKVHSITLKQATGKIKARIVLSDEGGGGQNVMIYYAKGEEKKSTKIDLPLPPTTIIEIKETVQITLIKKDENNKEQLKNARFVLKNIDTGKYAVNGLNTENGCTWSNTIEGATSYKTGDEIKTEENGSYQFYEVKEESKYYKACSKTENGKLKVGDSFEIDVEKDKETGIEVILENSPRAFLTIRKTDSTSKKELNNTRFVIKRVDTGQYAKGGTATNEVATWVSDIRQATWYAPKQEICFTENPTCEFYEVQRENGRYEECSIDKPLKVGNAIKLEYRKTITVELTNKRKNIKVSGYVWEDKSVTGKETKYDNLYNRSVAPDRLVANIKVTLKDKDGKTMQTTTTKMSGDYAFENVDIDKIVEGAYIEFTYNGMAYKTVALNANKTNGNKATEGNQRDSFNNKFQVITNNKATGSAGTLGVSYTQKNGISTLSYEGGSYGYSGQKYPVAGVASKYQITARTTTAGLLGQTLISTNDIYTKDITEITNVNLGIVEREQPDISLVKDVEKIQVSASGTSYTYKYADRFSQSLDYNMSPQVKFAGKYGTMTYTRGIYASDIYYNKMAGRNANNDLKIKVRYKIGIRNTSSTLVADINEIDDYYSNDFYMDKAKIKITKQDNSNLTVNTPVDLKNGYNKIKINNLNLRLQPSSEGYIFVELEIKQDQIAKIVESNRNTKLNNIAEISSYSIKDKAGKTYAGIDQDSNPGNVVIGQTNTYEDDMDKAPGLELVLQEPRKIDGNVFLDGTSKDLQIGGTRQGDGEYKSGESRIKGVEIKLVEAGTNKIAKKYNESTKVWEDAKFTTKDDGRFEIRGLLPGNYELVYEWGGKTTTCNGQVINVQNYKGTIYKEGEARWNKGEYWYKENPDKRYSDAQDDYNKRKEIDAQTSKLTNGIQEVVNKQEGKIGGVDLITRMKSTTPRFRVNLEWDNKNEINYKDELKDGKVQLDKNGYLIKADGHKNYIRNVDFGIAERPRQVLKLDKAIKSAKVIAANGNIIANATIVTGSNGKKVLKDQAKHVAYIPNKEGTDGQIKLEIDEEMIQGAKLDVEFSLSVSNISELDYTNREYYLYGKVPTNSKELVYLKASNIIDYLNDSMIADDDNVEQLGKLIREVNDKSKLFKDGLLSNELKRFVDGTSKILLIDNAQTSKKELRPTKGQNSVEIGEITVKGSKLLAKNEETTLENNAEIIQIEKSGGATLVMTTPGNYVPQQSKSEYDDDKSEIVYILPPTGLKVDYIAYTVLVISSLGILTCGIILIKKYVLK